ncbi:MAG TPA: hypothetical protein VNA20_03635 [Frankiaceae bacterium]|nr:hypothetical protein [Frankiaceae bacterium]
MSRPLARGVVALALAGAAFALPGTASAGCYGASGVFGVCTANRSETVTCLYTGGGSCQPVVVTGPLCVYGWFGSTGYYTTAFC